MKYKEQIIDLIINHDDQMLFDTLSEMPVLDQVDFLTEFKEVAKEVLFENGDEEQRENLLLLEYKIAEYQELYLEEQLASLKLEMAEKDLERHMDKVDEAIEEIRQYIKSTIETNAPNANEMRELAKKLIETEKEHDCYDPALWEWFKG